MTPKAGDLCRFKSSFYTFTATKEKWGEYCIVLRVFEESVYVKIMTETFMIVNVVKHRMTNVENIES